MYGRKRAAVVLAGAPEGGDITVPNARGIAPALWASVVTVRVG
jgi:hypothetical protein